MVQSLAEWLSKGHIAWPCQLGSLCEATSTCVLAGLSSLVGHQSCNAASDA